MILIFSSVKIQLQWSQRCSDQLQRKIQSTMEELSVIQEKLGKLSFILLNTNEICRLPCKSAFDKVSLQMVPPLGFGPQT